MSEMQTEMTQAPSVLTRTFAGVPGWAWLIGAGVVAYFLFFRNSTASGTSAGASASSGTGSPSSSGFTLNPGNVTINASNADQPKHPVKDKDVTVSRKVHATAKPKAHPGARREYVTVKPWHSGNAVWQSTLSGISKHEHVSVKELLKLNPRVHISNGVANIKPGQRIRYK